MKTQKCVGSSCRFLLKSPLAFLLISTVASAGGISYQGKTVVPKTESGAVRKTDSGFEVRTGFNDIPEATESCTSEESEWWNQIRKAGHDLLKKNNEKLRAKFLLLVYEGQQKAYRVPLKDRPHQLLVFGREPIPHDIALKRGITGTVVLSIEFRADASVGQVQAIKGLASGIDDDIVQATRQYVFLPAVKDRAFVAEWHNVKVNFADKWTKGAKGTED